MENKVSADLIRGHIDTIILRLLIEGDKYGYEISKRIAVDSEGEYQLKETSMYSCLKRLEQEENISSYWGDAEQGGRRRYYHITDRGRELYERNKLEWKFAKMIIDKLI